MFTLCVAGGPIVSRSATLRIYEEILGVVDMTVWSGLNGIDHLNQSSAHRRDSCQDKFRLTLGSRSSRIARGIYLVSSLYKIHTLLVYSSVALRQRVDCLTDLVEKHIFPISALGRKLLQITILIYSMLETELLPELTAD